MSNAGFYSPGDSFVHRLHASVKILIFAVMITVLPFGLLHWQSYVVLLLGLVLCLVLARVRRYHLLYFSPALGLIGLAAISWFLTDLGGRVVTAWQIGPVVYVLRERTAQQAIVSSLRAAVWALSYMVLLTTTSSRNLVSGLEQLRLPSPICRALTMTLKFWQTALADAQHVMDAQRVRGIDYDHGPTVRRFTRRFLLATLPTMFLLLKRFRTLSFALALRSFGSPVAKTRLYAPTPTWRDGLFSLLSLAFLLAVLSLDHYWGGLS
jgi:energy-coupling factor transport system permease protein